MKTLLLKFSGPLQSWGIDSHFEYRNTSRYPSKSAIIGLIAAAFGHRRGETEKIQELNSLNFAVRVDQPGTLLKDFHIAKSSKQTYVTYRYYLQDAIFLVAISHNNSDWIDEIEFALKHPVFQLFMGRRSAPVDGRFFLEKIDKDIQTVFEEYRWQAFEWYRKKYQKDNDDENVVELDAYFDACLFDEELNNLKPRDRVISFSKQRREHGFRPVINKTIRLKNIEGKKTLEHNAFEAIGGI
jgi:CRISPR system Cascade subunit CasD